MISIFDVLNLLCGIALFLYGMKALGDALRKFAGSGLKSTLGNLTSNKYKGVLLGALVTAVIQSSSATTVMVVGFVNSATMTLSQAIGVIMGANIGTAVTSWITGLSGIGGAGNITGAIEWFKPTSWVPIIAVIGIVLIMFSKRSKRRDIGAILIGFSILMVGMNLMSDSVSGLKESEEFCSILTMFENPVLGLFAGLLLTACVQSSSASIGIMQSIAMTGVITYSSAIPMIMGQNIGASITILLASVNANKQGKRTALVYLYFNIIGAVVWLSLYYIFNAVFSFPFADKAIGMWGIAAVHTAFKILTVLLLLPFTKLLEKLVIRSVPDKDKEGDRDEDLLDERLMKTPAIAVSRADEVAVKMAEKAFKALRMSVKLFNEYDPKAAQTVREYEEKVDIYEDTIGTYLVKLSGCNLSEQDSHEVTKLLHIIGDLERISDHAVNFAESAEECRDKKMVFSKDAAHELATMSRAVDEIMTLSYNAFANRDFASANLVEPLEQVVDYLKDRIKANHIKRLQNSECTIEHGFVLSDILTNFERVSDHCSNIAGCVIELSRYDELSLHKFLSDVKENGKDFNKLYDSFMEKYKI